MNSPKITVVIPMYNCEQYAEGVLSMFAEQSFRDFEVVCVIDGATDNTKELVEAFCSVQSARMMAMDSANKNAETMIAELQRTYNRQRQAMITQEITEVVSGAKALKNAKKAKERNKDKQKTRNYS